MPVVRRLPTLWPSGPRSRPPSAFRYAVGAQAHDAAGAPPGIEQAPPLSPPARAPGGFGDDHGPTCARAAQRMSGPLGEASGPLAMRSRSDSR